MTKFAYSCRSTLYTLHFTLFTFILPWLQKAFWNNVNKRNLTTGTERLHSRSFLKQNSLVSRSRNSPDYSQSQNMYHETRLRSQCFPFEGGSIHVSNLHIVFISDISLSVHNYFWKLCPAKAKLQRFSTFFNQVWEIGPQVRVGMRSKFLIRRRETYTY